MKFKFLNALVFIPVLFILLSLIFLLAFMFMPSQFVSAGTQHGVNGLVLDADDNTSANNATATLTLERLNCTLTDIVGSYGSSEKDNWYAFDVGNCPGQWQEGDSVLIFIEKDPLHNATTQINLSKSGNDQAPTIKLNFSNYCGDGICSGNETCVSCPSDCNATCVLNGICEPCPNFCQPDPLGQQGCCENVSNCADCICNLNGVCEPKLNETFDNCPWDCHCPNGICEPEYNETNITCPEDCYGYCGDGICQHDLNENSITCPGDCNGSCGDGICDNALGENQLTCPSDCALLCNYNGICEFGEFHVTCPDCPLYCGNMVCDTDKGETAENCPSDCGDVVCGDGICNSSAGEDWKNCPTDCYAVSSKCGDGKCLLAETSENCCTDCGCSSLGFPLSIFKFSKCTRNKCQEKIRWLSVVISLVILVAIISLVTIYVKKKHRKK